MVTRDAVVKPGLQAALLEPASRSTRARVIPAEFLGQVFAAMHNAESRA
jgi:hypothetical protein